MKKRITKYCLNFLHRLLTFFRIYPNRNSKNTFLPVVISNYGIRDFWKHIYKEYYDEDVDFSNINIPLLFSLEPHDLVFVHEIRLSKAYKNFSKKRNLRDIHSYLNMPGGGTELDRWYSDDSTHVRNPKNGAYAIWIKRDFQKTGEYFQKKQDIFDEKKLATKHVTLLEHFLHATYLFETTKYMPTPWNISVLCLGTSLSDDYYPKVTFTGLRFGAALQIEIAHLGILCKIFPKDEWLHGPSKDKRFPVLFSKVS